jgi:hypothetical protein
MIPATPPAIASPAPSANAPAVVASITSPPSDMIEMPVPLKGGICFYLKVPAGANLKKVHFDQFRRYVKFLESSLASDAQDEAENTEDD